MTLECPKCGGKTKVVNARPMGPRVGWRRHECQKCGKRFTTYERLSRKRRVSIYERTLPEIVATEDTVEMPFDCDGCHRKFTVKELADFTTPFANRGEQSGKIKCPQCGHEMNVQFVADSIQ